MNISENVGLKPYNTFGINANSKYFTTLTTPADIPALLTSKLFERERHLILGGGSNVLFTNDYDGLVAIVELKGIKIIDEDDNAITLHAGAGENWHSFVTYCVNNNYGGVENLSLIPGTTGAAPMQNIGAYGTEIKDVIIAVEAVEIQTGDHKIFSKEACEFGYRESIFKQKAFDKYIITGVHLRLTKRNHKLNIQYGAISDTLKSMNIASPTIKDISEAVMHIRRTKLPDPAKIGNAGSFFKNPSIPSIQYNELKNQHPNIPSFPSQEGLIKIPAGWLIEQCGWKGKTFDKIGVHANQALVIVNYGGGEGQSIWALAMKIQQSVEDKFKITLQPEVNVIK
ncbi:MAG: UDP-N-acetylmuramate dehydrogenase [Chryseolinea sp.]